jgi:hypothetical protein
MAVLVISGLTLPADTFGPPAVGTITLNRQ